MFHPGFLCCELVKDTEAADVRIAGIGEVFEREFFEAGICEAGEFGARERPGHLTFGVGRLAASGDDEKLTAWAKELGDFFDGLVTKRRGKDLQGVSLQDEIEIPNP